MNQKVYKVFYKIWFLLLFSVLLLAALCLTGCEKKQKEMMLLVSETDEATDSVTGAPAGTYSADRAPAGEAYGADRVPAGEAYDADRAPAGGAYGADRVPAGEAYGADTVNGAGSAGVLCFVHICGAVKNPGVYELPQGSRIFEAVEAAGGFTEQAAADAVNLAMPTEDGSKIKIPTQEEAKAETAGITSQPERIAGQWVSGAVRSEYSEGGNRSGTAGTLVNINTASAEMLCTLPGIGKVKAESIIAYREQKGNFARVEDIMKVEGIKQGLFDKIRGKITV